MSQSDPTDNALAAIASILDQPPVIPRERERPAVEDTQAMPPPLEEPPPLEASPSLAVPPPLEPPPLEAPPPLEVSPPFEASPPLETHAPLEAHGYSKVGPGPIAAIRFKWTVREDHGDGAAQLAASCADESEIFAAAQVCAGRPMDGSCSGPC